MTQGYHVSEKGFFGPVPQWLSHCLWLWDCMGKVTPREKVPYIPDLSWLKIHPEQIPALSDSDASEAVPLGKPVLNVSVSE